MSSVVKCWRDHCNNNTRRPSGLCERCVEDLRGERSRPALEIPAVDVDATDLARLEVGEQGPELWIVPR